MAVTLDTALGTNANAGATNGSLTTTAAVASGGTIFWLLFKFRSGGPGTVTPSGGGLTWATVHNTSSGNIGIWLFAAFAPSGLASGTTFTGTSSGGTGDYTGGAISFLGIDQSSTVAAATRAVNATSAGTAAWSSGTLTGAQAGDFIIGGAGGDGTLRTSTPGGDNSEGIDFNNAGTSGSVSLVYDLSGEANDTATGTWSGTLTHVGIGAAMIPAAGGGSQQVDPAAIASGSQLYAPTLTPGSVTVSPAAIASGSQLFAPSFSFGSVTVSPGAIGSTAQVYTPSTDGQTTVSPGAIASGSQVFGPAVTSTFTLQPDRIASGETVHGPTLTPGSVTVQPGHIGPTAQLYGPDIQGGEEPETPGRTRIPSVPVIPEHPSR